jgi:O-antigen/teichoic acid export membrane protein
MFQPATRFWMARQRFELKYKALSLVTIISAIFSPLIAIAFILSTESSLGVARLWGTNSVLIVVGLVFYLNIVRKSNRLFNKEIWKYALKFSIPLIPHYLAMHMLATSDRVMIQSMVGTTEAGLYGLAYTASMAINTAWTAIQGSLTPYVLDKLKKDRLDRIAIAAVPCLILFSIMCIVIVILAPEMILLLGGEKYRTGITLVPPLVASILFMQMYNLFSVIEFYHKRTVRIMLATFLAMLLNLALNYFAIQKYGHVAAAYTTLVCYIVYCAFHYYNMRRIEPRKIYSGKFLVVYSIIYIAVCFGCMIMYPYPFVRYCIVGALVLILLINRKSIMKYIIGKNKTSQAQ